MAITDICGWECRIAIAGAANAPDERHWDTANNTPTISTTTVRTGTASLRINSTAATQYLAKTIARQVVAGRVYVRFASFPAATTTIIQHTNASGNLNIRVASDGQILTNVGADSDNVGSPLSTGVWYRLDWLARSDSGTASIAARIDGGTEVSSSAAQAQANMTAVRFGANASATFEMFFEDLVMGDAAGDYPFGSGTVDKLSPDSDGAHNIAADPNEQFGYDAAGADVQDSATDVYTYVDDVDLTTTAEFIRQDVAGTGAYVAVAFPAAPHSWDAQAVNVVQSWHSAGTGANQIGMKLTSDNWTSSKNITDEAGDAVSDVSNTAISHGEKVLVTPTEGGTWTASKIGAIEVRVGYSNDVNAIPYWDAVMLEIAYGDEPAPAGPFTGWWGSSSGGW